MKSVIVLMIVMGMSCSYAMNNHTKQAVQNLKLVNQLIAQAETNLVSQKKEPLALVIYRQDFSSNAQVINLINQAKSLIDPIINNRGTTILELEKARYSLRRINLLKEDIDNSKK